jgi:hypothetical protein
VVVQDGEAQRDVEPAQALDLLRGELAVDDVDPGGGDEFAATVNGHALGPEVLVEASAEVSVVSTKVEDPEASGGV